MSTRKRDKTRVDPLSGAEDKEPAQPFGVVGVQDGVGLRDVALLEQRDGDRPALGLCHGNLLGSLRQRRHPLADALGQVSG